VPIPIQAKKFALIQISAASDKEFASHASERPPFSLLFISTKEI
jgi:hypothetical protein